MTLQNRPLLNANLRWFLARMILANIAGQMLYSMLSLYMINLGAQLWERFSPQTPYSFVIIACLVSISIAWARFSLPKKEPDIAFEG